MSPADRAKQVSCPDCDARSRRDFLKTTAGALAAMTLAGGEFLPRAHAAVATESVPAGATSETLAQQLYGSLSEGQRKLICFPFDHPLRSKVDNNWHIVKSPIGQLFNKDQRDLVRQIFLDMHSDEYAQRVLGQVEHDNQEGKAGGFDGCAVALFGEPAAGAGAPSKFEFVFTGRHVTRRCDGNSVEGEAFGGPIFYGHAAEGFNEKADHPGNIYWYQAKRANDLFAALDGKQRKIALRDDPRKEQGTKTVALQGANAKLSGIPLSELTADQKQLAREVMADVLAPFRKADAEKAMKLVEAGGLDNLHMTFYSVMDIGNDGVWDLWQIEGPSMVWYFRGAPHVHTWVHIRDPQAV